MRKDWLVCTATPRQDAGLLISTVIAIPFYLTHPKVMLDIPYILDSFHKLSQVGLCELNPVYP